MKYIMSILLVLAAQTMRGQLKWANVERVYNNLITAIGDGSKIAPPIKSSRSESRVAYYSPSKQTIFVEERFLQICSTFGADSLNALSFILGHELAHFYRNHGWVHSSGLGYVDSELKENWKERSKEADSHAQDEAEADIFSGFYSLIAGYNAIETAGNTLQKIYEAYGINDTVPGYPTLDQRIAISKKAITKSTNLYLLFKVGLYCMATEKYEVAGRIYTHIYNQDYAGAEILNNLAVSEILYGYTLLGEQPSYYYPVFISTETALDPTSRGGAEGEEHIRKGIDYLKIALAKDEKNTSFLINLASGYAMLNEYVDAEYHLAKAEGYLGESNSSINNLKAIISTKKGDEKLAKKLWKAEKKNDAFSANNYLIAFKDVPFGSGHIDANDENNQAPKSSLIDDVNLSDPQLKSKFDWKKTTLPGLKISFAKLDNSMLIEVYGGRDIDYRFQTFTSTIADEAESNWNTILVSTTAQVEKSENQNLLKITNSNKKMSEFVKFLN